MVVTDRYNKLLNKSLQKELFDLYVASVFNKNSRHIYCAKYVQVVQVTPFGIMHQL